MAKLLKAETLTVRDLVEKVNLGLWKFDTTTQRDFIYNSPLIKNVPTDCGAVNKAAFVIYNILNKDIILPAITIWHNTDTDDYNIHDGKQRTLSLYYFITGTAIKTYYENVPVSNFFALSSEAQEKLLNYQLVVQYNEGTTDEEKENFYEVNSNAINLTDYENLRSVSFGTHIYSFEDYLNSLLLDGVKKIERGEQAYKFLLAKYDINDAKQAGALDSSRIRLRNAIAEKIDTPFDPTERNFDKMIELFSRLSQIKFAYKGKSVTLSEDVALAVARFVIRNYPGRVDDVVELYRKSGRIRNDIPSWKLDFNKDSLQTHKRFIVAYLDEGLWLDPRRFFDDSEKDAIIKRDGQQCAHIDEATGIRCTESQYKVLQVDHIKPWSLGGRTDIDNAQLLCDKHNGSKGAR